MTKFTIDANILIYCADSREIAKRARALRLAERAAVFDCVLTVQALAEFFHAAVRKNIATRQDAAAAVELWRRVYPVVGPTGDVLPRAIAATEKHGLAFWDAMLWATARSAGCRWLITEDFQHGREIEDVLFLDLFVDPPPAELDALLG